MPCLQRRLAPPGLPRSAEDDGFTLVEILVTLSVVVIGLVALVPIQIRAAQTVALSGERQSATALAERVLEQIHDAATDADRRTAMADGGPDYSTGPVWTPPGEESLLTTAAPEPALAELTWTSAVGVPFTARTFVTTRTGDAPDLVRLTVLVSWSTANAAALGATTVLRSALYVAA